MTSHAKMLDMIFKRQHCMLTKMYENDEKIVKLQEILEKIHVMFAACHTGFHQVREACTQLREELAEATMSMVMEDPPV